MESPLKAWLRDKQPSMAEIPAELVMTLDSLLDDPANKARAFA